jgi:hypothetical protein
MSRIVSGSNATKFLDGICEISGALDAFLQPELEKTVEETLINPNLPTVPLVRIVAINAHMVSLTYVEGS